MKYDLIINYTSLDDEKIWEIFEGNVVPSQSVPIAEFIKNLPGRQSTATRELVFLASLLPPLGSKSYYIEPVASNKGESIVVQGKAIISNEVM